MLDSEMTNEQLIAELERLRKGEQRYRTFVDQACEGIWEIDLQGLTSYVNPAMAKMLGYTEEEMLGKPFWEFTFENNIPLAKDKFKERMQGQIEKHEFVFKRNNGIPIWTELSTKPLFELGNIIGAYAIVSDITERKQAEESLKESQLRIQAITDAAIDAILMIDSKGCVTFWNPAAEQMLGFSKEEAIGRDLHLLIAPERYKDAFQTSFSKFRSTGQGNAIGKTIDLHARRKDGQEIAVSLALSALNIHDSWHAFGIVRDIGERKLSEESLKKSEEKFRSLYESMLEGVAIHEVIFDEEGNALDYRILDVNPSYEKLVGINRSQAVGKLATQLYMSDKAPYLELYAAVAATGEPARFDTFFAPLNKHFSISIFSPIRGCFVTVFMDITGIKQAESELILARDAANSANKTKNEFLANMSHEIRTPLNGVLGMLQLLEMTPLVDEQKEYLLEAIKSSKRLTRLLADILDLSRIEAGKLTIYETDFDLDEVKGSILDVFQSAASKKQLNLHFTIDERLQKRLIGDETRLRQILFNLTGNAIKFTNNGHVHIDATLLPYNINSTIRVLFSVSDTGIGIQDNLFKDIFEPFVQAEGSYKRHFQGAGLGLSIVRKLVKLMHGELSLESTVKEGTTIYLSLPFSTKKRSVNEEVDTPLLAAYQRNAMPRILVAEDDDLSLRSAKLMLEKSGYSVSTAMDGHEALKLLTEQDFGLILMDIQMPVMDGVEATKNIRSARFLGPKSNIPIIAMTAYAMTGDREKFLAAGMNDYIAKPVNMNELKTVIERVMASAGSKTAV